MLQCTQYIPSRGEGKCVLIPEHEHNDGLDGGRLDVIVRVPHVLQSHTVELTLVDVRHLQWLRL
jgi:hypothetical protein